MLQPKSTRERYHYGLWLQIYLYNDLKDLAERTNDKALASVIDKAYLQGKWELIRLTSIHDQGSASSLTGD